MYIRVPAGEKETKYLIKKIHQSFNHSACTNAKIERGRFEKVFFPPTKIQVQKPESSQVQVSIFLQQHQWANRGMKLSYWFSQNTTADVMGKKLYFPTKIIICRKDNGVCQVNFITVATCKVEADIILSNLLYFSLKGAVSRDFLSFFYFINRSHLGP